MKNTLDDTISRLIDINPHNLQPPGHEYRYYVFESLSEIETQTQPLKEQEISNIDTAIPINDSEIQLSIKEKKKLYQLQQADILWTTYVKP